MATRAVVVWSFILLAAGLLSTASSAPSARSVPVVPAQFEDRLLATVPQATALAFAPDGRLLIATRPGKVLIYSGGVLKPTPALDLTSKVCWNGERGLLGLAVDPEFAGNQRIYLFYTFNKYGTCATDTATAPVNRVSRFILSGAGVVDPASETVLLDGMFGRGGAHLAGDLQVGKDGQLYASIGDNICDYAGDSGCSTNNDAARDQNVLLGKILRFTTSGTIPPDNPFQGPDSGRCSPSGQTDPGKRCQETYAWGLRNPFRIAFDPNAPDTRFFVNDVGQDHWEEVDLGEAGADYGWNVREGHCARGSYDDCGSPPAGMTNPIYDYDHADGCTVITGGAFVPDGVWPSAYDGAYLYADFLCGKIFALVPAPGSGGYQASEFASGLSLDYAGVVSMTFGPYGTGQALYYTTLLNGGEVHRIAFVGDANRTPLAAASATPAHGRDLPLQVTLDASASSDPDGDPLEYEWEFGDGSPTESGVSVTHRYEPEGVYTATVTARDGRGGEARASVRIDAGNTPPAPSIDAPAADTRFTVGETITLTGSALDDEDGNLGDSALSWTVVYHHNSHIHPFLGPIEGNNITFTAPRVEDPNAPATIYLEIRLTARDQQGLTRSVTQDLRPALVSLTFATEPSGLKLQAGGTTLTAPASVTSWAGEEVGLSAPSPQLDSAGRSWTFASWSDGGAGTHAIRTPATATTYTARFVPALLFFDDFELGNLSRWTSKSGLVVQRTQVYAGRYAARATSTGSPAYAIKQLAASQKELYLRLRFKLLRRGSTSTVTLARFLTPASVRRVSVNVSNTGTVSYRNHYTGLTRTSATAVSLSVWHTLQLHLLINGTAGRVEVWYDGVKLTTLARTESLGTTGIAKLLLGDDFAGRSYDVALDQIELSRSFIP